MRKNKSQKQVTFNLPKSKPARRRSSMSSAASDRASVALAVSLLIVIAAATVAWPYIFPGFPIVGTGRAENYSNFGSVGTRLTGHMAPQEYNVGQKENYTYSNFGSVGTKLTGHMAPQEYQRGRTLPPGQKSISYGNRFVLPNSLPVVTDEDAEIYEKTDLNKKASSALSPGSARVIADMNTSTASIQTPPMADPAQEEGKIMNDIKYATKGDGQIRQVDVNDNAVSDNLVKLAMFELGDFQYHLQDPELPPEPHLQDPSLLLQKSHFGPMKYPLLRWSKGVLAYDVRTNSMDTRSTISYSGGIPPIM